MKDKIISIKGLSKKYYINKNIYHKNIHGFWDTLFLPFKIMRGQFHSPRNNNEKLIWALKDITFDIYRGERIGIIGKNGAGKTTLLKILARLVYPTEGEAKIKGRTTALFGVGTGFKQALTGRENIYLDASLHGLTKTEIDERFDEIVDFSDIEKFIDTPVKYYSSGMYARLAFSVAAHLEPDILLLDEVLSVGDLAFQQKCLQRMENLTSEGRTVLFVSHSMGNISRFCDRCIWLEHGEIIKDGSTESVTSSYSESVFNINSNLKFDNKKLSTDDQQDHSSENDIRDDNTDDETSVTLIEARVINRQKETISTAFIDNEVGIEFIYNVLQENKFLVPAIGLLRQDSAVIFYAADNRLDHVEINKKIGKRKSIVWIPKNFLNEGLYFVNLSLSSPDHSPHKRHFFVEKGLSFYAAEAKDNKNTARGFMPRDFPGVIRPSLHWELIQNELL